MKIEKITFSQDELDQIFDSLTEQFNTDNSDIYGKGQTVTFMLNDFVEVEAKMDLSIEYSDVDENGQSYINSRSVCSFKIGCFYDGEELKTNLWKSNIDDKIYDYYRI